MDQVNSTSAVGFSMKTALVSSTPVKAFASGPNCSVKVYFENKFLGLAKSLTVSALQDVKTGQIYNYFGEVVFDQDIMDIVLSLCSSLFAFIVVVYDDYGVPSKSGLFKVDFRQVFPRTSGKMFYVADEALLLQSYD